MRLSQDSGLGSRAVVVVGMVMFLGSCLGCASHLSRSRRASDARRPTLTSQEIAALLHGTSVGFIRTIPKDRIRAGVSIYTTPFCTGWFINSRTLVSAAHCFANSASLLLPTGDTVDIQVSPPSIGGVVRFVLPGQQTFSTRVVAGTVGLARVTDIHAVQDLAVLTLLDNTRGSRRWLEVATEDPRPGDQAYTLGNTPLISFVFSTGLVSRVEHNDSLEGHLMGGWIQTSVPMAPGTSGGAMVNTRGEVIGVNNMIMGGFPTITIATPWWSLSHLWTGGGPARRHTSPRVGSLTPGPRLP